MSMFVDITEADAKERDAIPRQPAPQTPFSLETALLLAGFAFDVYNEPQDAKWDIGRDGTECAFLSESFVREVYSGVLSVTVLRAEGLPTEDNRLEAIATGHLPDPYVSLQLLDRQALATRPQMTSARPNTVEPAWNELFILYTADPANAVLNLALHDRDNFKEDDILGAANLSLSQVMDAGEEGWTGWVELPPPETPEGEEPKERRPPVKGDGPLRLQLDVRYVPFDADGGGAGSEAFAGDGLAAAGAALPGKGIPDGAAAAAAAKLEVSTKTEPPSLNGDSGGASSSSSSSSSGSDGSHGGDGGGGSDAAAVVVAPPAAMESGGVAVVAKSPAEAEMCLVGPKGGTPGIDWRVLTKCCGGKALTSGDFEPIVFLDNIATDTEVAVWRDAAGKRLVVSFRGTQADRWRDVLTDANASLEPLDTMIRGDKALEQWEIENVAGQMQAVAEGLAKARDSLPERLRDAAALLPGVPESLGDISGNLDRLRGSFSIENGTVLLDSGGDLLASAMAAVSRAGADGTAELSSWVDTLQSSMGQLTAGVVGVLGPVSDFAEAAAGTGGGNGSVFDSVLGAVVRAKESAPEQVAAMKEAVSNLVVLQQSVGNVTAWQETVTNVTATAGTAMAAAQEAFGEALNGNSSSTEPPGLMEDGEDVVAAGAAAQAPAPSALAKVTNMVKKGDVQTALKSLAAVQASIADVLGPEAVAGALGSLSPPAAAEKLKATGGGLWERLWQRGGKGKENDKGDKGDAAAAAAIAAAGPEDAMDGATEAERGQVLALQAELSRLAALSEAERIPKVHAGFRGAYASARDTLADVIQVATAGQADGWEMLLTGHSLGGALATLATVDLRRRFPKAKLTSYSFGAPRVGNTAFSELHDSVCGDSFRVVNKRDLVARMPRGRIVSRVFDYNHCGRMVLVDEDMLGSVWVEGESDGPNPAAEQDPLTLLTGDESGAFLAAELELLNAMLSGEGLSHHLEDDYFTALGNVVRGPSPEAKDLALAKAEEATAKWVWPA